MNSLSIFIFFLFFGVVTIKGADILAIFPSPFRARYIVAEPLLKNLLNDGHKITVISQFPQEEELRNFRDIVIEHPLPKPFYLYRTNEDEHYFREYNDFLRSMTFAVFENSEVKLLLQSPTVKFDLVITEVMLTQALYAFAPYFGAHLVGISMQGTDMNIDSLVGNTSPLSYIPVATAKRTLTHMSFIERTYNLAQALILTRTFYKMYFRDQDSIYRTYFPYLGCSLSQISQNFSLVLLNQHFSLGTPRPYVPNMIEVGGMYISKPGPLTGDIADFIDGAEFGVIYCAMGAEKQNMDSFRLQIMFEVFSELKERILFQHENPDEKDKPENVLIRPWFNQTDILAHPKVKLFIMHGGFLSILEAIYFAKPMIGLWRTYEQKNNIIRAESMGIALSIPYDMFSNEHLEDALERMLSAESNFTRNLETFSKRYHDQPSKPLDTAIYWIRYILRNNGAQYMRVAVTELNLFTYHSLDFIFYLIVFFTAICYFIVFIVKKVINFTRKLSFIDIKVIQCSLELVILKAWKDGKYYFQKLKEKLRRKKVPRPRLKRRK